MKDMQGRRGQGMSRAVETTLIRRSAMTVAIHWSLAAMSVGALAYMAPAMAAEAVTSAQRYHIPPGALAQVLPAFAAQAGIPLSFDAKLLAGKNSPGLSGNYAVDEGFVALLLGTELHAERLPGGGYTVKPTVAAAAAAAGELQAIEVSAQRTSSTIIRPTRQSNVIEREELNDLRQSSDSLASVLGKMVPGMADSSHTMTDYGQTLRGRNTLVLVDGIPLNTNRDSSRNMATLNLASIDKVEVLRGSSAIYGAGAAGGIIAVTTRPVGGEPYAETTVTLKSALSHLGADGLGGEVNHYMAGSSGVWDYAFNVGYQHVGGSFDGKGNRIAPEPSQGDLFDSDNYTLGGKLGLRIDKNQRLQLSISRYVAEQDSAYGSDPAVARLPAGSAVARPFNGLQLAEQNQIKNTLVSLEYQNQDVFGSTLTTQLTLPASHRLTPVRYQPAAITSTR